MVVPRSSGGELAEWSLYPPVIERFKPYHKIAPVGRASSECDDTFAAAATIRAFAPLEERLAVEITRDEGEVILGVIEVDRFAANLPIHL